MADAPPKAPELATRARALAGPERVRSIRGDALQLLAGGHTVRQVSRLLAKSWGLRRSLAEHYVSTALVELHKDASSEDIHSVRGRIVAMLHEQIQLANRRTRKVMLGRGEDAVICDAPDPNQEAALKAIWMLQQIYLGAKGGAPAATLEPQSPQLPAPLALVKG